MGGFVNNRYIYKIIKPHKIMWTIAVYPICPVQLLKLKILMNVLLHKAVSGSIPYKYKNTFLRTYV